MYVASNALWKFYKTKYEIWSIEANEKDKDNDKPVDKDKDKEKDNDKDEEMKKTNTMIKTKRFRDTLKEQSKKQLTFETIN